MRGRARARYPSGGSFTADVDCPIPESSLPRVDHKERWAAAAAAGLGCGHGCAIPFYPSKARRSAKVQGQERKEGKENGTELAKEARSRGSPRMIRGWLVRVRRRVRSWTSPSSSRRDEAAATRSKVKTLSLHAFQRHNTLAASVSPPESPCSLVVVTPELPLDPSDQGERATVTKEAKPFLLVNACVDDAMQLHLPPCPPSPPFLPTDSTRLLYYLLRFRHPAAALMLRPSSLAPQMDHRDVMDESPIPASGAEPASILQNSAQAQQKPTRPRSRTHLPLIIPILNLLPILRSRPLRCPNLPFPTPHLLPPRSRGRNTHIWRRRSCR
ncbi:hypothetical protein C8Q76DRAFT_242904 [Earliella scabrosa]|nr:hypothetical protein C8Q76DRAFT_242904 [Earliella scabrosa]